MDASTDVTRSARILLPDGAAVRVLPLGAAHAQLMARLLEALSPEDRRRRFFQAVPFVTPGLVRPLCEVDQVRHVAWIGVHGADPVFEARLIRSASDPTEAEVAFAVHPAWRGRSVATTAVRGLGVVAHALGVRSFVADVLPENRASVALLYGLGMRMVLDQGELTARGPVPPWTGGPDAEAEILALHGIYAMAPASLPAAA